MRKEKDFRKFAPKAIAALVLVVGIFGVLPQYFTLGLQAVSEYQSVDGRLFLTNHLKGIEDLSAGDYVSFYTDERMEPFFKPGKTFAKRVVGVPGDHVKWTPEALSVNGEVVAVIPPAQLKKWHNAGHEPPAGERVLANEIVAIGENKLSLDSRYFGSISADKLLGKVYLLW